ncbi:MAG: dephospho-CoA kinase [Flavobacteriales bacterium]|nr:dephospho-CoA kinase [Flavobacteriales bacterium]
MIKVGLTGGIGSGKTMVAGVFEHLGIPIYHADDRAKRLYVTDEKLKSEVIDLLGPKAYVDGRLNRPWIAERVFNDQELLERLNQLVHPAVGRDFYAWIEEQNAPYIVKEVAIMFESGAHLALDEVVLVSAPEEVRIERVMKRDGLSPAEIRQRMARQWTEEQRRRNSQHEIINDGHHLVLPQILKLHEDLIRRASS